MKAAVLSDLDKPLQISEVSDPQIRPDSVVVRLLAAFIPGAMINFLQRETREKISWALPAVPHIPGADSVGVIEEVGDEVHHLKPGQTVYCDDYVTLTGEPSVGAYVGSLGTVAGADAVLKKWPDGCLAEKFSLPAECVTPLGAAAHVAPEQLARLGYIGTSYHAIQRGCFEPGQTVIVNGATGLLGVGTVRLLLAMGAARVIAIGRRREILNGLEELDPQRVAAVEWLENATTSETLIEAAGKRAELFIDAVGFAENSNTTTACIGALARGGYAVLTGGIHSIVPIDYSTQMIGLQLTIRGSEWFPRAAASNLLNMAGSGALDLSCFRPRMFPLEKAQEAVEAAAYTVRGFEHVVVVP
jgi:alcohol dehydrogenase